MKVVHVLRPDHASHVGGDLHQLHACIEALRLHDVDAIAAVPDEIPASADIVHIYNLQLPYGCLRGYRAARRLAPRARTVLSPIYWPLDRRAVRAERDQPRWMAPLHLIGPRRRTEWAIGRTVLSRAACVLPNSNAETAALLRYFRLRRDTRWHVVRNGLWTSKWLDDTGSRSAGSRIRVSCVARVEPQKNQRRLIEAVGLLPQTELTLVGPPSEPAYANDVEVDLARLGDRGRWIRGAQQPEVREVLRETDVHVLPSFRETPGLASLEAAAVGCAVVVTREGSAEEYFGTAAHYADPRSAQSIASAIGDAAANPRLEELRQVVEALDWALIGQRLRGVYQLVLDGGPAPLAR